MAKTKFKISGKKPHLPFYFQVSFGARARLRAGLGFEVGVAINSL
jgi:hypothetical protein